MSITVLLVDDHELIRQGLARAFEREAAMNVVGQAGDVAEALAKYSELRPDVVVTDLQLPDGSGLEIVQSLRERSNEVGLVLLTMHAGDEQIFAAMQAGASAFVGKDSKASEVVTAAHHAAVSPRTFLCAGLTAAMARRAQAPRQAPTQLSPREQEVLGLLAGGLRTGEISRQLFMSESTTKTHIGHIYQKLDAANRAQAMVTAMRLGLLDEATPEA